jgi:hypothetical protein
LGEQGREEGGREGGREERREGGREEEKEGGREGVSTCNASTFSDHLTSSI